MTYAVKSGSVCTATSRVAAFRPQYSRRPAAAVAAPVPRCALHFPQRPGALPSVLRWPSAACARRASAAFAATAHRRLAPVRCIDAAHKS